jgi:hypothetical protein
LWREIGDHNATASWVAWKTKCVVSNCHKSGMYAKKAKHKKESRTSRAARLCFLNYLAFLRPAADRTDAVIPWVPLYFCCLRWPSLHA